MYRKSVPMSQLSAWLAAALTPTLLQLAVGESWAIAFITAMICGAVVFFVNNKCRATNQPILLWLQYLYIIVLLCTLLPNAANSWPGENYPAVPLILLALATWSTQKGARAAACVGCVLFWLVMGIYLFVLALGAGEIRDEWLHVQIEAPSWQAITLLLIPCGASIMVGEQDNWKLKMLIPAGLWIIATVVCAEILSPERMKALSDPLHMAVQSMTLSGTIQRFEALLSAGMTAGWFGLLTVLLSMSAAIAEKINPVWKKKALYGCAVFAGIGMLCNVHITWWILAILATVFWVITPILTQGLVLRKKM